MQTWRYGIRLDELRKSRGNSCQRRGCRNLKKRKLEFAHLAPTGLCGRGRGLRHRVLDIERNPEAYALLCKFCHKSWDMGVIKREEIDA